MSNLCPLWEQSWIVEDQHNLDSVNFHRCNHCPGDGMLIGGTKTPFSDGCKLRNIGNFAEWYKHVYGVNINDDE